MKNFLHNRSNIRKSFRLPACTLAAAALWCLTAGAASEGQPADRRQQIIPVPAHLEMRSGENFRLTEKTVIHHDPALKAQAEYLQTTLAGPTGYDLKLKAGRGRKGIVLELDTTAVKRAEGYRLTADSKTVRITARDAAGAFYGIQTLLQLLPPEVYGQVRQRETEWSVAPVTVEDAPNRPWRGMMLDVARYFYDKDFVKKYIDLMAMYKLNKLQFHFIDDSGWRLEIRKYPRLTQVGAWAGDDTRRLGGYYTQDDIREIVAYAAVRGVEIIPEIEFPAHMLSAVVAYPWLSCTGQQHEMPVQHFISRDLLCVGKETSLQFLRDVLEETVELFPSKYINIGGDEAVYTRWEQCPRCQALMKREGLKKASELQGYLTNVVARMMAEKGRTVMGWEEIILRGKVETPVVSVVWHNAKDTLTARQQGHKAVLTPATHMYFDFPESRTPGEVKAATWMPPISVERAYSLPIADWSEGSATLGVQGCFWSDQFIHGTVLQEIAYLDENRSENYAEYLTFPRLLALSEVAWARQADRNYEDFRRRLGWHFARLDRKDCHYRVPEPIVEEVKETDGGFTYRLKPAVEGADIVYTTDGSYPNIHSPRYTAPVTVARKDDFRAMTVVSPRHYSLPLYTAPDYSAYRQYGQYAAAWKPLQIQLQPATWRFECTGKITENGTYEVTFIHTRGTHPLQLGRLRLLKRDELMAEVEQSVSVDKNHATATYRFRLDQFEAGTPFYIEVTANGVNGNDTAGLVFIRKAE